MGMSLSSLHLEAFVEVAKAKNFSSAAKALHLTQSALSQRVINLEQELSASLFVRDSAGVRLTELGEKLLRYCQSKNSLEEEFLSQLKSKNENELAGVVRLASFSTYVRSVLLPKLGIFARKNPQLQFEVLTRELRDLPELLRSSRVDYIVSTHPIERQDYECLLIGHEENVLIESKHKNCPEDLYLDHDEADMTTANFWKIQKLQPSTYRRAYFDEIYTIIDAVEEGFGRAVVPRHLIANHKKVKIIEKLKPLRSEISLIFFKQAFYSKLHQGLIEVMKLN
jgi:DNA-binding transcriptional LysR family regulator